jgi:preprotein translocase subunit SecA
VTRVIENSQRKVEAHNFDIRKNLLEYDDVANDQRKVIYEQRNELMSTDDISDTIRAIRVDVVNAAIDTHLPPGSLEEQWDLDGLSAALARDFGLRVDVKSWVEAETTFDEQKLRDRVLAELEGVYTTKEAQTGASVMRHFEKAIMLQVLDQLWKEHLANMDHLRQGIHLRGYAQKNPKQEYKREAFEMFFALLERIKHEVVSVLCKVQVRSEQDVAKVEEQRRPDESRMQFQHAAAPVADATAEPEAVAVAAAGPLAAPRPAPVASPVTRGVRKVGRNEPCPCGSGLKYKQCHGKI